MPKMIIPIVKFLARAQNKIGANFSDVDYRIPDCTLKKIFYSRYEWKKN